MSEKIISVNGVIPTLGGKAIMSAAGGGGGGNKQFVFLNEATIDTETKDVSFTADANGNPLSLKEIYLAAYVKGNGSLRCLINDTEMNRNMSLNASERNFHYHFYKNGDATQIGGFTGGSTLGVAPGNALYTPIQYADNSLTNLLSVSGNITKVSLQTYGTITGGTVKLWGVLA